MEYFWVTNYLIHASGTHEGDSDFLSKSGRFTRFLPENLAPRHHPTPQFSRPIDMLIVIYDCIHIFPHYNPAE